MIGEDGFPSLVEWWIVSRNGLYSRANRVESCDKKRRNVEEKVKLKKRRRLRFLCRPRFVSETRFQATLCFITSLRIRVIQECLALNCDKNLVNIHQTTYAVIQP